jgi:glyceraldehyde 3-phosphate dehydrogenase
MSTPFAINGLGRIGRALVRITRANPELELVAVNDVADAAMLARLIARDTLHGSYPGEISADEDSLLLDGAEVRSFQKERIEDIPWHETSAAVVIDATGLCKEREAAEAHLGGSVRKVIVSANAAGMDKTLCMGVNDGDYDPASHHILSGGSCTTNCLAPIAYLLDRDYTIRQAFLNTVHSYNNDQSLLESPHSDPRRARAAALNMIPTTTSAIGATVRILPQLEGKLDGFAIRVPTPNVSLIDLVVALERDPSVEELNALFTRAAEGELEGIVAVSSEELVSSDFLRNPASAVVDLPLTSVVGREAGERLYRIVAWYDNEWAHASRLADLLQLACTSG